jgi:F0F1-type ATP synthase membrane subunit b/b'
MKKTALGVSLLIIICSAGFVYSGEIDSYSLDKLMELSGLNKQVAEVPGMVRAGVEQARQQGSTIPDAEFDAVMKSIEDAFQPSDILMAIRAEVKKSLSEAEAETLMSWYESALGKKITKAEEEASTPAAFKEMMSDAESLLADQQRVGIANTLDELTHSTDRTIQIGENAELAVFTALSKAINPEKPVPVETFKSQMSAQKQQMRTEIKQMVTVSSVYAYKDIDISSLKKYIEFNERPNTQKFNNSVMKGMDAAFNQSVDKMATSMATAFKEKHTEKR